MKNCWICMASFVLFSSTFAAGQSADPRPPRASGYFFAAPGGTLGAATLHFGGGADILLKGGLGVSTELGYLAPFESLGEGIGVLSVGALYQFGPSRKTVPFVTGGYGLAFRGDTLNLVNFGGGVNHWFNEHWGLRIEGRVHTYPPEPAFSILEVRFGIDIR
ncbi:MAG: hypothetical protein ACE5JX_17950 [Acidobacteriota bacterium]